MQFDTGLLSVKVLEMLMELSVWKQIGASLEKVNIGQTSSLMSHTLLKMLVSSNYSVHMMHESLNHKAEMCDN